MSKSNAVVSHKEKSGHSHFMCLFVTLGGALRSGSSAIANSRACGIGGLPRVRCFAPVRAPSLRSLIPQLVAGLGMLLMPW